MNKADQILAELFDPCPSLLLKFEAVDLDNAVKFLIISAYLIGRRDVLQGRPMTIDEIEQLKKGEL